MKEQQFKGTLGMWHEENKTIFDENNNVVPSKTNFYVTGRLNIEEVFGKDEEYIKSKHNDNLKVHSPELLEALRDLVWLFEQSASNDEIIESINAKANVVLNKILF